MYLRSMGDEVGIIIYGTNLVSAWHLATWYVLGMLFTFDRMRAKLNLQKGSVALLLLIMLPYSGKPFQYLLLYLLFPYFIFSFVSQPEPVYSGMERKTDLSYGIYLYGFFFQQLLVSVLRQFGLDLPYIPCLLISFPPTAAAAYVSSRYVEQPMQRISKRILEKLDQESRRRSAGNSDF